MTGLTHADLAARHLEGSESAHNDHEIRKLEAFRGIGYALLAIHDRLTDGNAMSGELADQVHAVADQVGDLAIPADRLADAAEDRARRTRWSRRRREPDRCLFCRATRAEAELECPGGTWQCVKTGDCMVRDRARLVPGVVMLSADAAETVRHALADAIGHRHNGDRGEFDERLVREYDSVLTRLGGAP